MSDHLLYGAARVLLAPLDVEPPPMRMGWRARPRLVPLLRRRRTRRLALRLRLVRRFYYFDLPLRPDAEGWIDLGATR